MIPLSLYSLKYRESRGVAVSSVNSVIVSAGEVGGDTAALGVVEDAQQTHAL